MDLFRTKCMECGADLIQTSSQYYLCPNGHGGLVPATSVHPGFPYDSKEKYTKAILKEQKEFLTRLTKVLPKEE